MPFVFDICAQDLQRIPIWHLLLVLAPIFYLSCTRQISVSSWSSTDSEMGKNLLCQTSERTSKRTDERGVDANEERKKKWTPDKDVCLPCQCCVHEFACVGWIGAQQEQQQHQQRNKDRYEATTTTLMKCTDEGSQIIYSNRIMAN